MIMNNTISVIVPVYNVEEWLDQCVESIVKQTYSQLEIILVDDGSPDNCPRKCDEWAQKDKRIKVIHKKNGGLSSARNAALEIATGEYVSFIDSDDYIHKDMYKIMLEKLIDTGADVVKCGRYLDNSESIQENKVIELDKEYTHEEVLDCFFYHKDDFCSGIWDKLFKMSLFDDIRFPDGLNSEDYYVYGIIYNRTNKLYFTNTPLYYYRIREGSICREEELTEHSFDKITVSNMVYDYVMNNYPSRKEDAQIFQAIARFAIYQKTMKQKHTKSMEREWIRQLKEKRKTVLHNKKIGILFKIKYLIMSFSPRIYLVIK